MNQKILNLLILCSLLGCNMLTLDAAVPNNTSPNATTQTQIQAQTPQPTSSDAQQLAIAHSAWMQNRPAEALPILYQQAQHSDTWYDYFDLARAAYDNGQRIHAIAWFLESYKRAPAEAAPRAALRALHVDLPRTWLDRIGILALLGTGYWGLGFMLTAGLCLGAALFVRQRRWLLIIFGSSALVIALPASVAHSLGQQQHIHVVVNSCPLLGPTGQALQTLEPGTLVFAEKHIQAQRMLVHLANNQRGFIDSSNCNAQLDD